MGLDIEVGIVADLKRHDCEGCHIFGKNFKG